jgi:large subunit ribosomal protein L31
VVAIGNTSGRVRRPYFQFWTKVSDMKPEIHPQYQTVKATCSCGNVIEVGSTLGEDIHLDVCSNCHPFYTGKQKNIDSGGRVERFRQRFGNRGKAAASEE